MFFNRYRKRLLESIERLEGKIHHMSTTVNAGLAALQQADSDLTAAITAITAATDAITAATQASLSDISDLVAKLGASEDPEVQTIASDLEVKISVLEANTAALTAVVTPSPAATPAV